MKQLSVCLVALAGLLAGCGTNGDAPPETAVKSGIAMAIDAPSIATRDKTEVLVYLPSAYDDAPDRRYPVVYFLHGWGSDAGAFERLGGVEALNALTPDRKMIVVSVSGETSGYQNWADGKSLWEDHLLGAIGRDVEKNFRVQARPTGHGAYGVSMGGAAALRLAMSHTERFLCAAAHSAAISPVEFDALPEWQRTGYLEMDDFAARYGDPFDADMWRSVNPLYLAQTLDTEQLSRARYYFDVGADDHLGFADDNEALSQALTTRGVPHIFNLREGGHGGEFVKDNMASALEFLSGCLAGDG